MKHCVVLCTSKQYGSMSTDRGWTVLCVPQKTDRSDNKLYYTTAFTTVDVWAAILDSELRVGEALPTFLVVNPTCRIVPVKMSYLKLENTDN